MQHRLAIILAAGKGQRLMPLTHDRPKCLVDVQGTTPLAMSLDALRANGVKRVVVVTGYRCEYLERYLAAWPEDFITTVYNPQYETANNVYSAYLVAEYLREGALLLNSDIVYHPDILRAAVHTKAQAALVIDPREGMGAEEMKVYVDGDKVTRISKLLKPEASFGEFIGIMAVRPPAGEALARALTDFVVRGDTSKYYEHAIDSILEDVAFTVVSTHGLPFTEIDTLEDLRVAEKVVAGIRKAL
jgi:choline kinase